MSDYLVTAAAPLLAASKNRDYRERVILKLTTFIRYMQDHGLTTRVILQPNQEVDSTTRVMESDLTQEGLELEKRCFSKWLKSHDRGKPITDMTIFDKELAKLRK